MAVNRILFSLIIINATNTLGLKRISPNKLHFNMTENDMIIAKLKANKGLSTSKLNAKDKHAILVTWPDEHTPANGTLSKNNAVNRLTNHMNFDFCPEGIKCIHDDTTNALQHVFKNVLSRRAEMQSELDPKIQEIAKKLIGNASYYYPRSAFINRNHSKSKALLNKLIKKLNKSKLNNQFHGKDHFKVNNKYDKDIEEEPNESPFSALGKDTKSTEDAAVYDDYEPDKPLLEKPNQEKQIKKDDKEDKLQQEKLFDSIPKNKIFVYRLHRVQSLGSKNKSPEHKLFVYKDGKIGDALKIQDLKPKEEKLSIMEEEAKKESEEINTTTTTEDSEEDYLHNVVTTQATAHKTESDPKPGKHFEYYVFGGQAVGGPVSAENGEYEY